MLIKKQFFYTVLNYKDIKLSNNSSFSVTSVNSYSLALYELAKENNSLDLVEQQVNSIIKLIKQSEDFNILIRFLALSLNVFLYNSIQVACLKPLPTLPLN